MSLPITPGTIDAGGKLLAKNINNRNPGAALSELERGRILIKDAFAEGRLISYDAPKSMHRYSKENSVGCAGAIVEWGTDRDSFFALALTNNKSPYLPDGTITDFQYIEAALDVAYRILTGES